jgi:hypothetical protein
MQIARPFKRRSSPESFESVCDGQPDFLCIGAQKAGTSWLYFQLKSHPDFWMPPVKEIHYFDQMSRSRTPGAPNWQSVSPRDERDRFFLKAMADLCATPFIDRRRYGALFAPKGHLLSGDITPFYSALPEEIIARIIDYFPKLKIVFIARDPVERAWSALSMGLKNGGIPSFDMANCDLVIQHLFLPSIIMRSFPSMIVARWRRWVPAEQMGVYFFDDLEKDPDQVRAEIIRFLGAEPAKAGEQAWQKINQDQSKLPLSTEMRDCITGFFADELRACATDLGGAAGGWPARYGL